MLPTLPQMRTDWALFLDIDGTLLDLAATPDAVEVPGDLTAALSALHCILGGAIAFVSGREIAVLDRLFTPVRLPAAGQHGAELRDSPSGEVVRAEPPPRLADLVASLNEFTASRPGLLVEHKGASVAVHYRQAPRYRGELQQFIQTAIAENSKDMEMLQAQMAFEIKWRSVNKGHAVAWFMSRPPFHGRVPVFIGDDLTDEDGFDAVTAQAGHAIQVGTARARVTSWHAPTPSDLRLWLHASVAEHASS
jgi:trehalose 6-phosphate phosphatase